jgi:hypothetical protein
VKIAPTIAHCIRASLCITLAVPMLPAAATRCRNGTETLYTQDASCPAGYSAVSNSANGSVSTLGKSDDIRQREQDYLASSATARAERKTRDESSPSAPSAAPANGMRTALCEALADQYRAIDLTMGQPNGPHTMNTLDKLQRDVRNEQMRNGC